MSEEDHRIWDTTVLQKIRYNTTNLDTFLHLDQLIWHSKFLSLYICSQMFLHSVVGQLWKLIFTPAKVKSN